jgi:hypothetical protein
VSEIRIHRSDPVRDYVKVCNAVAQDGRLSWAARGYLIEQICNHPAWEPESGDQAVARALRERPGTAEPAYRVRAIIKELERYGYRHRVNRRGAGGKFVTEIHYYDWPALPCEDSKTCDSCKRCVP